MAAVWLQIKHTAYFSACSPRKAQHLNSTFALWARVQLFNMSSHVQPQPRDDRDRRATHRRNQGSLQKNLLCLLVWSKEAVWVKAFLYPSSLHRHCLWLWRPWEWPLRALSAFQLFGEMALLRYSTQQFEDQMKFVRTLYVCVCLCRSSCMLLSAQCLKVMRRDGGVTSHSS